MTKLTVTYTRRLVIESCCACGITFGIPEDMQRQRLNDRKLFYCPAGHEQHYVGETKEQKLQRELEAEQRRSTRLRATADRESARADHEAARARGYKGALTKVKRRVGNGVCPCCNRSFADLAAHMAGQHPDYVEDQGDG